MKNQIRYLYKKNYFRKMTGFYLLLSTLMLSAPLISQDSPINNFPEGVYYTLQDFIDKRAVEIPKMRKMNMGVPASQAFKDTLIDHCMFIDGENDPLKKVFAVVYKSQLYFPEYSIKKYMLDAYRISGLTQGVEFHRVQDLGKFLYLEITYTQSDPNAMVAMGYMFGALGAIAASAIPANTFLESPVVYDTSKNVFLGLYTPKQLQLFMDTFYPSVEFNAKSPKLGIEDVRKLIQELNSN